MSTHKTETPTLPEAFAALGVRPSILRALADAKFTEPSDIQKLLIPRALAGIDILGQARTGTGKTAAFGIPILARCSRGLATQGIILVPTRELAVQVDAEIKMLAAQTPIRSVPVYGGQKISAQMKFLKTHPEVLVGTPGRVIDLLDRRIIHFDNVRFVVLDEVDRMLDIGFRDDIRNILSRVKGLKGSGFRDQGSGEGEGTEARRHGGTEGNGEGRQGDGETPAVTPSLGTPGEGRGEGQSAIRNPQSAMGGGVQTIFVSATISSEIERLARQYMRGPVEKLVAPGADEKPTVENVEQWYFSVQPWDKYRLLKGLLERENPDLAIVFCRTKHGAQKLAKRLHVDGIECREIHGDLQQSKRERVMKSFRGGKFDVLIATDLASRGIDVADITHIINFDIPEDPEVYVHRVGRTARMGAAGKAFTFVTREQGDELTKVESLINMIIPQAKLEGFEPRPEPSDWTPTRPGQGGTPTAAPTPASAPQRPEPPAVPLPVRTLGSKIPITRRHRRRR